MKREEVLSVAKPILFNTDMVRAIIDGRKTATRRVMKPQPMFYTGRKYVFADDVCPKKWEDCSNIINTYQYQPGDILYVRETWAQVAAHTFWYRADSSVQNIMWHPSIHMPKEAARIFLRVTNVRVERLQDMPHDGAYKEGIHFYGCPDGFTWKSNTNMQNCYLTPMSAMKALWDSTIKKREMDKYGWDANPWVWVIEFERVNVE